MTALIKRVEEELGIKGINGKDIFDRIPTDEDISNIVDSWIEDIIKWISFVSTYF